MFSKRQILVLSFVFIGMVTVILAATWFIGRTLSSGGPPESVTLGRFKSSDPSNLSEARVVSQSRCSTISADAQAQGVKEAWLVVIEYKSTDPKEPASVVDAYALIDRKWLFLMNRRCP